MVVMDEFLKMDIFFVVTTVMVLIGGILLAIALFYVVRILRNIDHISENVSEESDHIKADIGVLRENVRKEGVKLKHFADFFGKMAGRRGKRTSDS